MRSLFVQALVAIAVCALAIGAYDRFVRVPRTPRLAVVDVAVLYATAQRRLTHAVAQSSSANDAPTAATAATATRAAEDFGPALQSVLKQIATECRCTLVAMAAVFGADDTLPDVTEEAARRLELKAAP
jgi:hypothetical protein